MIRFFILVFSILIYSYACAQESRDYNWQLGLFSSSSTHANAQGIEMKFGDSGILIDSFFRAAGFYFFNASIADENGNLLLYSNGCNIRDANHNMIAGTSHLNPGDNDIEFCNGNFGYPLSDAGIFLPFLGDSILLLVHQRSIIESNPTQVISDSLFYTSVKLENSEYTLLKKSIPIVGGHLTNGNVEAVKASQPGAWWVIQSKKRSNQYLSILLDSAKVDTIITYFIGDSAIDGSAAGQSSFSPDGNKYARYAPRDDLFFFNFDRSTGLLSNFIKIHVADSGFIGGLAFSPNSRFLYVSSQLDIYQFDTWAADIEASKVHLGHYDGYVNPFPTVFYHMQLGPDCRIYMNSNNGTKEWHVIHKPDLKGNDCQFEQHGFHFPVYNTITMPNFPNYRLDVASVCDPGLVTHVGEFETFLNRIQIYPVPTNGPLWIKLPTDWDVKGDIIIELIDNLGRSCYKKNVTDSTDLITIGIESLASGVYTVVVTSRDLFASERILKTY